MRLIVLSMPIVFALGGRRHRRPVDRRLSDAAAFLGAGVGLAELGAAGDPASCSPAT
jgi:hypothetical protein